MTKRILCRVVRSVPFSKSTLWYAGRPVNKRHNVGHIVAADIKPNRTSNSTNYYIEQSYISGVSVEAIPAGQILDCYI
jgi:hypothetical protein